MQIISINIGKLETIGGRGTAKYHPAKTGINKQPVQGPSHIGKLGLQDDAIGNKKYHGGFDQAVYLYSQTDYAFWESELGRPCPAGIFGENLTVDTLDSAQASIGDRYTFGDVILEVTSPRIPCSTLAAHMGDTKFAKAFQNAGRPGVYCRVIHEGAVTAGMMGHISKYDGQLVSLLELFELYPFKKLNDLQRSRFCSTPINAKYLELIGQRGH